MTSESTFTGIDLGAIFQGLTLAFLIWFWNAFNQVRDKLNELTQETKEWQAKIDVVVFGATGSNGLNGTVKDHEVRLRLLEQNIER